MSFRIGTPGGRRLVGADQAADHRGLAVVHHHARVGFAGVDDDAALHRALRREVADFGCRSMMIFLSCVRCGVTLSWMPMVWSCDTGLPRHVLHDERNLLADEDLGLAVVDRRDARVRDDVRLAVLLQQLELRLDEPQP
jgi:hypothetical protein